ncbi:Uncharacterized protein OS=Pirellula staleyi (strain ATCC 27377 / DSM 6068 / ICPB 4128) GN=Psta_0565 PE=4 SV=1 [Gemmataceae bacterium]|nr:Uncharacterized protein OS=Pirellula staleyi (strain ATCC 27377 / DSM 6068 / ICPB 4128) GN=Psta_0565 PE=4 SV=1 [Gemmataceae bacterium]VTT97974.1 Uncharacterized protein OS=Pirellula staleyi (strain ATCC 27377 / DSM 6068 / ICPB 4128) GN=Psta_0565 PE=4 SV=1 [Gemmataceae bacterium]
MISPIVENAVRTVYQSHPDAADVIVNDPQKAAEFAKLVNQLLPKGCQMTVAESNRVLITMRKRGKNNGGLAAKSGGHGPGPGTKSGYASKA